MSWPNHVVWVPNGKHHWRHDVDDRFDVRGDLTPTVRALRSPGARPAFPLHAICYGK